MISLTSMCLVRSSYDENDVIVAFSATFSMAIIVEVIFYFSYRTKVKLYLNMKLTEKTQDQLYNLLDIVPNKVLICSKASEEQAT